MNENPFRNARESFKAKNKHLFNRERVNPCQEKLENAGAGETVHKTRISKADSADRIRIKKPAFKITLNFRFADFRRRDLDGAATTCLDSLVTVRRLLAGDSNSADDRRTGQD